MRKPLSTITKYTDEEVATLTARFLRKLRASKLPLKARLKEVGMPKGTYSSLINSKHRPSKKVMETMRAYLEGRDPKFKLCGPNERYCCSCESILPESSFKDRWVCKACHNEVDYHSRTRTGYWLKWKVTRRLMVAKPGTYRDKFLENRRQYYLRRNYGAFAKCVETIKRVRKEIQDAENNSKRE